MTPTGSQHPPLDAVELCDGTATDTVAALEAATAAAATAAAAAASAAAAADFPIIFQRVSITGEDTSGVSFHPSSNRFRRFCYTESSSPESVKEKRETSLQDGLDPTNI